MIKQTINPGDGTDPGFDKVTISPYPGDFERHGVEIDYQASGGPQYVAVQDTETQYLVSGARLVWGSADALTGNLTREQRLTLPVTDLIQSTSSVIDLMSGDLLEPPRSIRTVRARRIGRPRTCRYSSSQWGSRGRSR